MLMLKFVVSPAGVNTTAEVFTYITCMENPEQFVSIYRFKGFLEVDENNGSFFLMILLRAGICEDVDRRGLNPFWFGLRSFLAQGKFC